MVVVMSDGSMGAMARLVEEWVDWWVAVRRLAELARLARHLNTRRHDTYFVASDRGTPSAHDWRHPALRAHAPHITVEVS